MYCSGGRDIYSAVTKARDLHTASTRVPSHVPPLTDPAWLFSIPPLRAVPDLLEFSSESTGQRDDSAFVSWPGIA